MYENFYNAAKKIIESKEQPAKRIEKLLILIDLFGDMTVPKMTYKPIESPSKPSFDTTPITPVLKQPHATPENLNITDMSDLVSMRQQSESVAKSRRSK